MNKERRQQLADIAEQLEVAKDEIEVVKSEEDETSKKQQYNINTFFIFKGVFTIKATSEQEARKLVEEQCGLVLGGGIHSTIDDDDVDWNFDMHPEQVIKSIKKK